MMCIIWWLSTVRSAVRKKNTIHKSTTTVQYPVRAQILLENGFECCFLHISGQEFFPKKSIMTILCTRTCANEIEVLLSKMI